MLAKYKKISINFSTYDRVKSVAGIENCNISKTIDLMYNLWENKNKKKLIKKFNLKETTNGQTSTRMEK